MDSIVITPKTESEFRFINDLLKKIRMKSIILTDEEKEDMGLLRAMKMADRSKKVSEESVMKKTSWEMKTEYLVRFYKDLDKINSKTINDSVANVIHNVKISDKISSIKNIKKIKSSKIAYRIRIGDYRIGIYYENDVIEFARILHRKDIYKFFPQK